MNRRTFIGGTIGAALAAAGIRRARATPKPKPVPDNPWLQSTGKVSDGLTRQKLDDFLDRYHRMEDEDMACELKF